MSEKVPCPRCGQDWLVRIGLVRFDEAAIYCPECDALWLAAAAVGADTFVDYTTYMDSRGVMEPHSKTEIRFGEPLDRREIDIGNN